MSKIAIFILIQAFLSTNAVHDSMNFVLKPLHRECFYEDFDSNSPVRTIDAFVQAGGNVDVLLTIHGPLELESIRTNKFEAPIVTETINVARESTSETLSFSMDFKPKSSGTFGICLDNRNSRFLSKIVQLDVRLASRPQPVAVEEKKVKSGVLKSEEEQDEEELERAKESISRIRKGLVKIQVQQQRDRHRLSLHTQTNSDSHRHVVTGSIVETFFFLAAAIFQILFVRRWFNGRSPSLSAPRAKEWA